MMSKKVIHVESCGDCPLRTMNTEGKSVCGETFQIITDEVNNGTINKYCTLDDAHGEKTCCKKHE